MLCINDLPININHAKVIMYADDTSLVIKSTNNLGLKHTIDLSLVYLKIGSKQMALN
jgi:hypothetical protein